MLIRALTGEDSEAFRELRLLGLQLHPEAFGSSYEEESQQDVAAVRAMLVERQARPGNVTLGAFVEGQLVGMVSLSHRGRQKTGHQALIWGVLVHPGWRGRGIAQALMQGIIETARRVPGVEQLELAVATDNAAALRLYQNCGFQTWGEEKKAIKLKDRYVDEYHMVLYL
ncbi:MAG: GNAT family N-acetyltransferase [Anaerolineae bacterium]|nr:GNAT family N-acetyltransferase [Anaerolineae bacterium]